MAPPLWFLREDGRVAIGSPHELDHWFASSRVHHGRGGGG
jgi:hypothetical protein